MKIKKIILDNVKSYSHAEFDFEDGINFVSGRNGAGKTTIIESIGFALFGYKIIDKGFADYFIARTSNKASIRVIFSDKIGKDYIVDRKLSRSAASNSWIIKDFETELEIVSKDEDVKNWLRDNLGFYIDDNISDIYKNIVSVPQGEYTSVFLTSDNERKLKFDPIFNLESYKKIYLNTSEISKDLNQKIIELDKKVSNNLVRIDSLEEVKQKLVILTDELKDIELKIVKLNKTSLSKEQDFKEQDKLKNNIEKIVNEIKLVDVRLQNNKANLVNKKQDLEIAKIAKETIMKTEQAYSNYIKLEEEKVKLSERKQEFDNIKQETDNIEKNINLLLQRIEFNNLNLDKDIKEQNENNQKLVNLKELQNKNEEELDKLKLEYDKKSESLDNIKVEYENVKKIEQNIVLNDLKIQELNVIIEKKQEETTAKIKLDIEIENINKELETEDKIKEQIEIITKELNDVISQRKNIENIITNLANGVCPYLKENCKNIDNLSIEKNIKIKEVLKIKEEEINIRLNKDKQEYDKLQNLKIELSNKRMQKDNLDIIGKDLYQDILRRDTIKKQNFDLNTNIINLLNKLGTEREKIDEIVIIKQKELEEKKSLILNIKASYNSKVETITELGNKNTELTEQSIKLKNDIKKLEENLEKGKKLYTEKNILLSELNIYINRLKEIEEKQKEYFEEYNLYQKNIITSSKFENLEKEVEELKNKIEIDLQNKSINEDLKHNLEANFKIEDYDKLKNEITENKNSLSGLYAVKDEKSKQELLYNQELEKVKIIEAEINLDKAKIVKINNAIKNITKIRMIINDAPKYISKVLIKHISDKAANIYATIALDNTKLEWQEGYNLVLHEVVNGNKIIKEFKQLSGGEQMSAALSIRIAMLETMTKLHIGILDEPTTNMDANRRGRLAEIIEEIGGMFNQLFIVSHDDTFNSITDNIIDLDSLTKNLTDK